MSTWVLVRKAIETFGGLKNKSKGGSLDHKSKAKLARQIIEEVTAKGGRFVKNRKLLGSTPSLGSIAPPPGPANKIVDCFFEQVDESAALRMVKQSFRYQLQAMMREDKDTKQEAKNQRLASLKSPESRIDLGGTTSSAPPQPKILIQEESSEAAAPPKRMGFLPSTRDLLLADGIAMLRQQAQEGRTVAGLSTSYCCSSDYRNMNTRTSVPPLGGNPLLSSSLPILCGQLSLSTSPSIAAAAGGAGQEQGLIALHRELLRSFLYLTKEEQEGRAKKLLFSQQQQHGGLGIQQQRSSSTPTPSYFHPGTNNQFLLSSSLAGGGHGSGSSSLDNSVVATSSSNPTADAAAALLDACFILDRWR